MYDLRFGTLLIGLMLVFCIYPIQLDAQDETEDVDSHDRLAYVSQDGHLILHNPETHTETLIAENVGSFLLSPNGYLAFVKSDETDNKVYFSDLAMPEIAPIPITQNSNEATYPLSWSPDGQYLAFGSYQDIRNHTLYVWDGETVTNIMPNNPLHRAMRFYGDWSLDGRFVFTITHDYDMVNPEIPAEIYIWDGDSTMNLSQNPEGEDWGGKWSDDGRLMFKSWRNDESDIYLWDGITFKDGLPDTASFTRLAPERDPFSAVWLDNGFIRFMAYLNPQTPPYTGVIATWDVKQEIIIEEYPITGHGWLTEDGQFIFSARLASGLPSAYLDVWNLADELVFSAHVGEFSWSSSGYLAYCLWDEGWILSIWDGEETWEVSTATYRPVQWQSVGDTFSCNNG